MQKQLVMVSGAPGAGKTTIAAPLAAALRFSLLSKDLIKETLHDALAGAAGDLQESRRLSGASMELLWTLAAYSPHAVLEANFRPHSRYERDRLRTLEAQIVEVHCACPLQVAAARFAARARSAAHHPVHVLPELSPEMLAEFDRPVGIGQVLEVDTSTPVDVGQLALEVRDRLSSPATGG